MDNNNRRFRHWFQQATGHAPYLFQVRFACGDWLRNAVPVPDGRTTIPSPPPGEWKGEGASGLKGSEVTNCEFKLGRSLARRALCFYDAVTLVFWERGRGRGLSR